MNRNDVGETSKMEYTLIDEQWEKGGPLNSSPHAMILEVNKKIENIRKTIRNTRIKAILAKLPRKMLTKYNISDLWEGNIQDKMKGLLDSALNELTQPGCALFKEGEQLTKNGQEISFSGLISANLTSGQLESNGIKKCNYAASSHEGKIVEIYGNRDTQEDRAVIGTIPENLIGIYTNWEEILKLTVANLQAKVTEYLKEKVDRQGSCLNASIITEDTIYTANLGDSTAWLVTINDETGEAEAKLINRLDNPNEEHERKRLEDENIEFKQDSNGIYRIDGLAVSKAIGDNGIKGVSHDPEIYVTEIPKKGKSFLITACDGLTENGCLTKDDIAKIVHQNMQDPAEMALALVKGAYGEGDKSQDNISVIVTPLSNGPTAAEIAQAEIEGKEKEGKGKAKRNQKVLIDKTEFGVRFAGIFDGHGGDEVSNLIQLKFARTLNHVLQQQQQKLHENSREILLNQKLEENKAQHEALLKTIPQKKIKDIKWNDKKNCLENIFNKIKFEMKGNMKLTPLFEEIVLIESLNKNKDISDKQFSIRMFCILLNLWKSSEYYGIGSVLQSSLEAFLSGYDKTSGKLSDQVTGEEKINQLWNKAKRDFPYSCRYQMLRLDLINKVDPDIRDTTMKGLDDFLFEDIPGCEGINPGDEQLKLVEMNYFLFELYFLSRKAEDDDLTEVLKYNLFSNQTPFQEFVNKSAYKLVAYACNAGSAFHRDEKKIGDAREWALKIMLCHNYAEVQNVARKMAEKYETYNDFGASMRSNLFPVIAWIKKNAAVTIPNTNDKGDQRETSIETVMDNILHNIKPYNSKYEKWLFNKIKLLKNAETGEDKLSQINASLDKIINKINNKYYGLYKFFNINNSKTTRKKLKEIKKTINAVKKTTS